MTYKENFNMSIRRKKVVKKVATKATKAQRKSMVTSAKIKHKMSRMGVKIGTKAIQLPLVSFFAVSIQAASTNKIIQCYCEIDGAIANQILSTNIQNRPLKRGAIDQYCGDMQRDKWFSEMTGDPIRINENGNLSDGQHRMVALIESGTTQIFQIQFNVPSRYFKNFDTGTPRKLADIYGILGYKNPNDLSALSNLVQKWEMGDIQMNYHLTNDEGIILIKKRPEIEGHLKYAMKRSTQNRQLMPLSIYAFLHYAFSKMNKKQADEFLSRLSVGDGLLVGDPIYVLREKLLRSRHAKNKSFKMSKFEKLAASIRAWNHFREGRDQISSLSSRVSKEFPKIV